MVILLALCSRSNVQDYATRELNQKACDHYSSSCERQCKANQYVTTTKYFCFFINATL